MKRPLARFLGAVICACAVSSWADEAILQVVTEEFPPYNYTENHEITGMSTEVVKAVLAELKINADFRSYPWVRAYKTALTKPNVLIYSIGRNEKRENLFKWVGVVAPAKFYLFALKQRADIKVNKLEEAKQFLVGTFRESVREQYLLQKGFKKNVNIISYYDYKRGLTMLVNKRIDLWAMNEMVAYYICKNMGYVPDKLLSQAYFFAELSPEGYYMAFNKDTDDTLVNKLQQGLMAIKNKGILQKIHQKYVN
ncbi:transporter substrate-binding domain-containing protein [Endozoicomonas sp. SM1973]|uniref:Transporter substrate-binding domain-containing protein n=1 Tax=Spartinivicinus marinus TaxID=2994442 RepID=A0A853I0W0_9GAMM|nr:transporter substrate-binding domain-containing protein [Spartinivicinus marinus]MCX4029458.1 transporter substrate-binding domain-containing protein [Spartinivicinus marinus]NYZ65032.1 transporter substrate-binding domain-containing protein [Spartinivicinus marinus]